MVASLNCIQRIVVRGIIFYLVWYFQYVSRFDSGIHFSKSEYGIFISRKATKKRNFLKINKRKFEELPIVQKKMQVRSCFDHCSSCLIFNELIYYWNELSLNFRKNTDLNSCACRFGSSTTNQKCFFLNEKGDRNWVRFNSW